MHRPTNEGARRGCIVLALTLALVACRADKGSLGQEMPPVPAHSQPLPTYDGSTGANPAPVVNKSPDLPPDGQVVRDTLPYIVRVARGAALSVNPKKFVITKKLDPYEKDECNATVLWSKQGAWPWTVTAVYQRSGDFWKFKGLSN